MFSKSTEYALRATIYIAQNSDISKKLCVAEIAEAIGSPKAFTAKVLQKLTINNAIISSMPGPHGGFYFTKEAGKLPIKVILEAMNEDVIIDKCILGLSDCSDNNPCPMHHEYKFIKPKIKKLFEQKTIAQLVNGVVKINLI